MTKRDLTGRQQQIVMLASYGLSNREIGVSLGISESTVKVHLATIFRRLGVENRAGAVGMWMRSRVPVAPG